MGRGFARETARNSSARVRAATFGSARFLEGQLKAGQGAAAQQEDAAARKYPIGSAPVPGRIGKSPPAFAFRGLRPANEPAAPERPKRGPVERPTSGARPARHGETRRRKPNARHEAPPREILFAPKTVEKTARTQDEGRCRGKPAIEEISRERDEGRRRDRSPQGISSQPADRSQENEPAPPRSEELETATRRERQCASLEIDPASADRGPTAWRNRARSALESFRGREDADQAIRRGRARRARTPMGSALAKPRDARGTAMVGLGSRPTAYAMLAGTNARREDCRRGDSARMDPLGTAMPRFEVECLEPAAMRWRSPPRRWSRFPETGKRRKSTGTERRGAAHPASVRAGESASGADFSILTRRRFSVEM